MVPRPSTNFILGSELCTLLIYFIVSQYENLQLFILWDGLQVGPFLLVKQYSLAS